MKNLERYFALAFSILLVLGLTTESGVQAQVPNQRDFDVVFLSGFNLFDQSAFGTSNGVGWKICGTFFSSCCGANTNGTYNGFNTGDFAPPVAGEDMFHLGGQDFTVIFDRPVGSIVFYLRENGGIASFDFGLTPTVISGGGNLNIIGTRIFPTTSGGAVRFDNVNSRTITGVMGAFDGMNLAFYVESVAPGAIIPAVCPGDCVPVEDPDVRTQGFWKRVCKGPHPSGEDEKLPDYVGGCVNDTATFANAAVCDRLNPNPKNDKCEKAEAHFMALLLNVCSGRVAVCNCIDDPDMPAALTVGDAIDLIDDLLSNANRTFDDCVVAQSIADAINDDVSLVDCP